MRFTLSRTSNFEELEIEISSLEDLEKLYHKEGRHELIISFATEDEKSIEIYDDYRE